MQYIPTNAKVSLEWTVKRGIGSETEDFSRSTVSLFLYSDVNRWPVPCEAGYEGVVKAELPEGLPEGVYSLELVWVKNNKSINATRCIQRTRKACVFAIDAKIAQPEDSLTIKMTTVASSYGYDGLSAYEIAVLRGATTLDEFGWSKGLFNDTLAQELNRLDKGKQNQLGYYHEWKDEEDNLHATMSISTEASDGSHTTSAHVVEPARTGMYYSERKGGKLVHEDNIYIEKSNEDGTGCLTLRSYDNSGDTEKDSVIQIKPDKVRMKSGNTVIENVVEYIANLQSRIATLEAHIKG